MTSIDALKLLRYSAALSYAQNEPCSDIGAMMDGGGLQGDVDCSNSVTSVDSLKLLRFGAGLTYAQNEPCPDIGS